MLKFKHFIWDFDGTLFDTYPAMAGAFYEALIERGVDVPVNEIMSRMKVSMSYAVKHYGASYGLGQDFFIRYDELRAAAEDTFAKPFDGAAELLRMIKESGGENFLYTHRDASASRMLEKFELDKYFTEQLTHERGFPNKPDPAALLYLKIKYGFADGASMIGDREIDVSAAVNAGIRACRFGGSDEPSAAEMRVKDFFDLRDKIFF